ncbi:MAG: DNA-processing protein DprA [Gemmatimonadetes bacterium]|nr:DNA-processing protein DprA [Gemmatimonadota bacterium]
MPSFFPDEGLRALTREDADYPARLRDLHDAPGVVYVRGRLLAAHPPAVAIVGTRNATPYGLRMARALATTCARAGVTVVSGLARGIDAAAHEAALVADGRTVGVLGTGPDVYYPRSHRTLQERIASEGMLLSELPAGSTGHPGAFPRRNRLIAALADVTVVVEAPRESGALITARVAEALGRDVAVVPNAIDVPQAAGSNALLRDQAHPLLDPDDVLRLLGRETAPPQLPALDGDAARCWDALQQGADEPAAIAAHTGLTFTAVQGALALLEIDGLVSWDLGGRVRAWSATG